MHMHASPGARCKAGIHRLTIESLLENLPTLRDWLLHENIINVTLSA